MILCTYENDCPKVWYNVFHDSFSLIGVCKEEKNNMDENYNMRFPIGFYFGVFVGKWFAKMSHYILFQKGTSAIMACKTFLKLIHHNYEDSKAIKSIILTPIDFSCNFPAIQSTSHNIQIR